MMSAIQDMRQGLSGALRAAGLTKVFDGWAPATAINDSIQVVPNQSGSYLTYQSFSEGYVLHMEVLIVSRPYASATDAWDWLDETLVTVLQNTMDWDVNGVDSPALVQGTECLAIIVHLSNFVKIA